MELLRPLRTLAIADANKRHLAKPGTVKTITPYIEKNPAHKDIVTTVAGTLLELSFLYDSDEELVARLMLVEMGIEALLEGVLTSEVGEEAMRYANTLLMRISPSRKQAQDARLAVASPVASKHLMLSYSWASKAAVKRLEEALRAQGVDVWRDEVGSSVLVRFRLSNRRA